MKEIRDTGKEVKVMDVCQSCGQISYLTDGVVCEPCDIEMWGE